MTERPAALVTGASRRAGIGAAIARWLARDGWDIALSCWRHYDGLMPWGSRADDVEELAADLRGEGARTTIIEADLGAVGGPAQVFASAQRELGSVTAMVMAHTHDTGGGVMTVTAQDVDRHLAVNIRGTLLLIGEFARNFSGASGPGRVVTFTSGLPLRGSIAYAASKGAIEWVTVSAASELAGRGITVTAINPGPNATGWMPAEVEQAVREQSPFGRVGTPEDTAALVSFLCSDDGGWITGQVLTSDGGWSTLRP